MNKNDYRRALIMLRSLKSGVSGYIRLERRTLTGTLHFTLNGTPTGTELYAVLLSREKGAWSAVRAGAFGAPRYGQTGLVWKFDPRNIEGRTLEQYGLAAVVGIRSGVCELLLTGNLNGSVEADLNEIREAACRLFSPVRISSEPLKGTPSPKADTPACEDQPQTLPDYSEEIPADPGPAENTASPLPEADTAAIPPIPPAEEAPGETAACKSEAAPSEDSIEVPAEAVASAPEPPDPTEESVSGSTDNENAPVRTAPDPAGQPVCSDEEIDVPALSPAVPPEAAPTPVMPDELDVPAAEPDEMDIPASDANQPFLVSARAALSSPPTAANEDAAETATGQTTAGQLLGLSDPQAVWPESIEPLRSLFFSSESITPFEADDYVFIRAPLPEETGVSSCVVGLSVENGVPSGVLYAIPAAYTPEPPAGLEGYNWFGDMNRGYWIITENVSRQ